MPLLPFRLFASGSRPSSRPASPLPGYSYVAYDEDPSSDEQDPPDSPDENSTSLLTVALNRKSSSQSHLLPRLASFTGSSAAGSPFPSRPASPAPQVFASSVPLYTSTSEDEPSSPLLLGPYGSRRRRWWARRRKREINLRSWRGWKRVLHNIVKHPLFPTQPLTILLTLLLLTTFALLITVSLIYLLNPDKYALPWRQYCSHSTALDFPPSNFESLPPAGLFVGVFSMDAAVERRMLIRTTWASHVRSRGMDSATDRTVVRFILGKPRPEWERRVGLEMQVYNDIIILPVSENMNEGKTHAFFKWAHENALVPPSHTNHTFNPVHRIPSPPKVPAPAPIPPSPKSSSSESSSSSASDVPEVTLTSSAAEESSSTDPEPQLPTIPGETDTITPRTGLAPEIRAPHDPRPRPVVRAKHNLAKRKFPRQSVPETWVAPDYVIKADDDSFVMLAELEARLRVEWDLALKDSMREHGRPLDPLIFWGYLVKSRFMAGELYALSSALVEYIATTAKLQTMIRGAEDKTTSKWIKLHPQADQVRWRSEHCWIYDHPRAGTVYSHGFLFPSEARRVAQEVEEVKEIIKNTTRSRPTTMSSNVASLMSDAGLVAISTSSSSGSSTFDDDITTTPVSDPPSNSWDPDRWKPGPPNPASTPTPPESPFLSHSTVSKFHNRYGFPISNLSIPMQVEALVEGSPLSRIRNRNGTVPSIEEFKWEQVLRTYERRETYAERYAPSTLRARGVQSPDAPIKPPSVEETKDVPPTKNIFGPRGIGLGGTVVVHFIKRNEWFLEAAMAMLGPSWNGDEGRIDPGSERSPEEKPGTVIAKTQSFKRDAVSEELEAI